VFVAWVYKVIHLYTFIHTIFEKVNAVLPDNGIVIVKVCLWAGSDYWLF